MQEQPRADGEWGSRPGRGAGDDGIRQRLRALFAATDDEEAAEALILERGRELEEQTARLRATIEDLERREEEAGRLRSAVEELLRHGSAELDARQAQLSALAFDLRARAEQVREQERDIAVRKQELGAVELRRAAVERREAVVTEHEAALERITTELGDRGLRLAQPEVPGHILYLPDAGYRIVERDGGVPAVAAPVEVDGREFVVVRVGRSTLPGDARACAYLEPARNPPPS